MISLSLLANALLPIAGLIAVGWYFRQLRWLTESAENGLMRLVVWLFYPALIFQNVFDNAALRAPRVLLEALLAGSLAVGLGMVLGLWAAPLFGLREGVSRRTFAVVVGVFNFGYLSLPLAADLYGAELVGVMMAVNAGIEIPIWSLGLLLLHGRLSREAIQRVFSPPLLALLVAAPLNLLGGADLLHPILLKFLGWAAPCAIPLGLVLIGSSFRGLFERHGRALAEDLRPLWAGLTLRLLALPAIMVLAALWLPVSDPIRQVLLIHAAMPCGIFPVVLAQHYGGNAPLAFLVVAGTSMAAIVTMPLWLTLGGWIVTAR